jgi:hypothetical protein
VFCLLASLAIIADGTWLMWVQHSGVPARVTVLSCAESGPRLSDRLYSYAFGDSCGNYQIDKDRYLEFWGVYRKDVGHEIDVHIAPLGGSDEAVPDAWIVPPIEVGVGFVLGVAAVIGIVRRVRPAPMPAAWTGQPWPGTQ